MSDGTEDTWNTMKILIDLCQSDDIASTTQLRAMAQNLGITNFDTMNKRCLCHTMALLWRKNDTTQVQLRVSRGMI